MGTFLVRLWLPDRPGALGAVASRIGAVRGDVVGIDILERGGGRAIDELAVELPSADLVPLLVAEVSQVDGVDVEDVREAHGSSLDPRLDALTTAARLVDAGSPSQLLDQLVVHARDDLAADWSAVLELAAGTFLASTGDVPAAGWVAAFVTGRRSAAEFSDERGPDDVASAELAEAGMALVLCRHQRPFRVRERRQLGAVAGIADRRWRELNAAGAAGDAGDALRAL